VWLWTDLLSNTSILNPYCATAAEGKHHYESIGSVRNLAATRFDGKGPYALPADAHLADGKSHPTPLHASLPHMGHTAADENPYGGFDIVNSNCGSASTSGTATPLASPGHALPPTDAMRAVVQRTSTATASPALPPRRASVTRGGYHPSGTDQSPRNPPLTDFIDDGSDSSSAKCEYETVERAGRAVDFRAAILASSYASHTVDAGSESSDSGEDEGLYSIFVGTTPAPAPTESRGKNIFRKRSSTTTPEPGGARSSGVGSAGPGETGETERRRSPSPDPFTRPATPEHSWAAEFVKQHAPQASQGGSKSQTALV